MKNKKILLGLAIGAIMATTPFITACSSDITFNQSDLDNALKNVNEYLETQNNYSSEFAKNVLNDYLLKGIERNQNNSQFAYKIKNEFQNSFDDSYASYVVDYKIYKQDSLIKELCKVTGDNFYGNGLQENTNNYRETTSEYKQTIVEEGQMSVGKTYYYSGTTYSEKLTEDTDKYSKTTFENNTIGQLNDWMLFGDISNIYSNLMLSITTPEASIFGMGDYFSNQTDVVMGQDGEYETFTFTNVFAESGGVYILSFNIKFKNGILDTIIFTISMKSDFYESLKETQVLTIEISEKTNDFTFDKTPY